MYNAVQHPYNKEIQGVDIKKATIKSLFELLCIFNCRTPGFARKVDTLQVQGKGTLTFVIAGSLGPSPAVVKRAELRWKLSDLTFPHQLTRLLVLEQVYRAHMILAHRPYHK